MTGLTKGKLAGIAVASGMLLPAGWAGGHIEPKCDSQRWGDAHSIVAAVNVCRFP